jgi:S-methylmethionine-dependent homocysteine/selenocysteine methylase
VNEITARRESKQFLNRLREGPPLLLDAAMGSDLDRRGLATKLPLWSALGLIERPELVRQIHVDNLLAGADIITTDTFRTTARTLRAAGLDPDRAEELDALAVELARQAKSVAGRTDAMIAGSIAPLEDCYLPVFDVAEADAYAEHAAQARSLAAAGADFLMIETMPTATEAAIALRAARETGLPATVGFVCAPAESPGSPVRLLSGETLADAVRLVEPENPAAIFVNCAGPEVIAAALQELRQITTLPIGGYANAGRVDDEVGWAPDERLTGEAYAQHAGTWLRSGARVIGGCCGTHAAHTAALRRLIDTTSSMELTS